MLKDDHWSAKWIKVFDKNGPIARWREAYQNDLRTHEMESLLPFTE